MATSPVTAALAAQVLRSTSALVVMVEPDGTIRAANPAAAAAIGCAAADLVGEQATSVLCTLREHEEPEDHRLGHVGGQRRARTAWPASAWT